MSDQSPQTDLYSRLSSVETRMDSFGKILVEIQDTLKSKGALNWAAIGVGIVLLLAVIGGWASGYVRDQDRLEAQSLKVYQDFVEHIRNGHPEATFAQLDLLRQGLVEVDQKIQNEIRLADEKLQSEIQNHFEINKARITDNDERIKALDERLRAAEILAGAK